ncbi:MAG: DJ-1/PfpI family protein [Bacilli bacterium]|jgi:4-methyl-5(b-hydroxyethyl)-thiazole monophosphate biosynthesis|nr:DJ-1/PfpI family protein [Bacilli bacterium]
MVYILLGDGFEEAEAVIPADLLRRAGLETRFVGLDGLAVTGGHGITITADITLEQAELDHLQMLVLPGGQGGVESIQMNLFALSLIQRARDRGCYLAAICAAPTILAHLGIIDRRRAVCYPGLEHEMGSAVVQKGQAVVADGRIVTGMGPGSAFEFGLKLVEVLRGKETALRVKGDICYYH